MKRFKFIFDDGEEFDTIARSFRQACLNVDKWMESNNKTALDIAAMKEWW
jgi:hypothetical protein